MAKQLNVKLNFQADTSQAEQALAKLTMSLNQISSITPTVGTKLTDDLATAKQSALDLQRHLNNAFNAKTGNLDLSKLDASLKSSGQSLGQLSTNLLKAGSSGESAFLNIQRAVGNASVQINQANGVLTQFWTTLKNTARWQLSSSLLHGFIGGLQSAWGYAKDLDESLNNIRIVTGYSVDKMSDFAEQANKAAKALSTTTTAYTDAALIYYQQGLSDDEVLKRTDITVKMANVARQSAEVVSDQLTAIWNNFYDGSKSLEYYADVLTALGAATASSTDEIAGGLEKFAAIGQTIGLSYEYAASALATITANTRQSEEVVGTALKTIFARIQGLNLGETLDDGTTLNKYSEALQKVGISIFDQAGELKDMDNILDEMGAKWQTLNKAQQTALAQTVAGVRQYTQLVALMDNWDAGDSDSMQANLDTSYNATGTLNKQAEIYADSWEAAVNRVKASAEGIYRDLLPTEEMTGMMKGIEVLLEGVDGLVRGLGGLEGILLLISSIALNAFKNQIGGAIDDLIAKVGGGLTNAFNNISNAFKTDGILGGFKAIVGYSGSVVHQTQQLNSSLQSAADNSQSVGEKMAFTEKAMAGSVSQALKFSMEMTQSANNAQGLTDAFRQYNSNLITINNIQSVIEQSTKHLTKEQREQLVIMQEQAQAANEQVLSAKKLADEAQRRQEALLGGGGDQGSDLDRYVSIEKGDNAGKTAYTTDLMNTGGNIGMVNEGLAAYGKAVGEGWNSALISLDAYRNHLALVFDESIDLTQINKEANSAYGDLITASADVSDAISMWSEEAANVPVGKIKEFTGEENKATAAAKQLDSALDSALSELSGKGKLGAQLAKEIQAGIKPTMTLQEKTTHISKGLEQATEKMRTLGVATGSSEKHMETIKKGALDVRDTMHGASTASENLNNKLSQVVNTLNNALQSAMSFGRILSNMASGFSSIAMGISAITNAIETINDEDASFTSKLTAGAMAATMGIRGLMAAMSGLSALAGSVKAAMGITAAAEMAVAVATGKATQADLIQILTEKLGMKSKTAKAVATKLVARAQAGETAGTIADTAANWANVASQAAKLWYVTLIIAAIAALVAIIWAVVSAEDAETKALKAANEQLEASKNAYDRARDAAANFKEEVSDYEEALNGLKELTAGTEEMADAVEEANKKARKLIETYGLFGQYSYGANGEIIFNEGVLDGVERRLNSKEKQAEVNYYGAKINQIEAQSNYDAKQNVSSFGTYTTAREYNEVAIPGGRGYTKKEYLNYLDPETTASRSYVAKSSSPRSMAQVNGQTGIEVRENTLTSAQLKDLGRVVSEVTEDLGHVPATADELIEAIGRQADHYGLSEAIWLDLDDVLAGDSYEALLQFCDSLDEAAEASRYYAAQILGITTDKVYSDVIEKAAGGDETRANLMYEAKDTILANNAGDRDLVAEQEEKSKEVGTQIKGDNWDDANVVENAAQAYIEGLFPDDPNFDYDTWLTDNYGEIFKGSSQTYDGDLTTEDMGRAILESDGYKITEVDNKNGKIVYSVIDAEGNTDDITYGNEEIANEWGSRVGNYGVDQYFQGEAAELLSEEDLGNIFNNIVSHGEQYGADFTNAILAGIANGTGEFDFSSVFGELAGDEIAEIKGMDGKALAEQFLGITNEEDLKALGFESWADFEEGFKNGLEGWDPTIYSEAMNKKYEAIAESHDLDADEFKAFRSQVAAGNGFEDDSGKDTANTWLNELKSDNVEAYTAAVNDLAIVQTRLSRGSKSLGENWKDWDEVLSDSNASIEDIAAIMPDLNEALADILNWDIADIELLPADFAQKYRQEIEDVYNGVDGAIEKLAGIAANEYMISIGLADNLTGPALEAYNNLSTMLMDMPDLEVGMTLNDTGMYDAFQALLDSGAVTAEQMNNILKQIGFSPDVSTQQIPVTSAVASADGATYTVEYIDTEGEVQTKTVSADMYHTSDQGAYIEVPVINGANTKYTGGGGVKQQAPKKQGGGGGGGGSKPKKTADSRKKKSDVVDRYKEINDKLEESNRLLEKNNTEADRLWGPKRLAKLKENVKIMEQENKQLKQKYELSKQYLDEDAAALREAASAAGISFNIDSVTGNITNYTDAMTQLFNEREALLNSFGSEMDEKEQERLEELDKKIDKVKEAYEDYEKTLDEKKDLEQEQLEKLAEIQQQYYDILSEELEIKLTVNDTDLKVLEYYLGKVQDDFFNMAEAAALMFKDDNFSGYNTNQFDTYMKELGDYQTQYDKLVHDYTTINPETGETYINQAQFIEGLQQIQDGLYENLQNIQELDNTMLHYYGDTLAAAAEELEKFTSLMDHHVETLDHYANLLELLGKSKDFDRMKTVLQTQVDVAENAAEVSKANYEMLAQEAADKKAAWDAAQNNDSLSDYEKSVIEQQWLDAQNAANEAQNQMLEDAEAWAEALKSLLETELAELADTLDKSLSGEWGSLDNMMTAMERASSLQEEYLTTTNQVYETNKLMRTAQQEIDKTTNSVAKRRLKSFIDETEQLQNKNKLSEYELEIQQAKYDLLLAEIALEEAQQAKSTVRLQRDSEGNFGYVYTADQNEIANAQQELEDAQNALYNIGLEGANKYAESYAQTIQEMNDAITELSEQWANGEITSKEEFDKRRLELEEYYGEKLMQYSELHSIALQTDSRVSADAWTRDFAHMTTQTQLWMSNVDIYVAGVEQSMGRYEAGVARIEESVGLDLDSLREKTENIKNENEALRDSIAGEDGLLDAIKDEITEVGKLTLEYAKMRQEMEAATTAAENLAAAIGQTIANESDDDESNDLGPGSTDPDNPDPDPTPPTNPDPDPTPPTKPSLTKGSAVEVKSGTRWYYDSYGSGPSGTARNGTIKYTNLSGSHPYNIDGLGWIKKTDIVGYDTGGYTGNWEGSYGKLAFLHQKELILNAQDTENLLASMDILDKIISTIDLYSSSAQLGGMLSTPRYGGFGEAETLEQNVHIEASFPSVTDHNEIEDALNNLINRASQYAHRK